MEPGAGIGRLTEAGRGENPRRARKRGGDRTLEREADADLELPLDVGPATLPEAGDLSERSGRRESRSGCRTPGG